MEKDLKAVKQLPQLYTNLQNTELLLKNASGTARQSLANHKDTLEAQIRARLAIVNFNIDAALDRRAMPPPPNKF